MPTPTYDAIAKSVPTTNPTFIEFTSIPSTYTDLMILYSARNDASGQYDNFYITVNGSSGGTEYSYTFIGGFNATIVSSRDSSTSITSASYYNNNTTTSNTFGSGEIYIPNYAGSTNKIFSSTGVSENNNAGDYYSAIGAFSGLRRNTAAITSIKLVPGYGGTTAIVTGSRFDLYGIKNS